MAYIAARNNRARILEVLALHGADFTPPNRSWPTPLFTLLYRGYAGAALAAVLSGNSDPTARNSDGTHALTYARSHGKTRSLLAMRATLKYRRRARVTAEKAVLAFSKEMPEAVSRIVGDFVHVERSTVLTRDGHDRPTGGEPPAKRARTK